MMIVCDGSLYAVIFFMGLGTYLTRALPFLTVRVQKLPTCVQRFFTLVPAAALGALLMPDMLEAVPGVPLAGLLGVATAFAIALWRGGFIVPIAAAVAVTLFFLV